MSLPPELQAALLGKRVVFLRGPLDAANANNVIAQLVLVARTSPGRTLELYVDSRGGSPGAALSVYDVLQTLGTPVSTTCTGTAGGAAALILAGGAAGLRFALPSARVQLSEATADVPLGRLQDAEDAASTAREAGRVATRWREALARHVRCPPEQLTDALRRGAWLTSSEALDYGLIDTIVGSSAPLR